MKNAKIKEQQQLEFFAATSTMSRDEMLEYCTNLITNARVPNHTLINQLKVMGKDSMILSVSNFIMKGHGYGVK